jgi:hypothetical protein
MVGALSNRRPGVGLMTSDLWSRLTPEGERLRDRGIKFGLCFALCGLILFGLAYL